MTVREVREGGPTYFGRDRAPWRTATFQESASESPRSPNVRHDVAASGLSSFETRPN